MIIESSQRLEKAISDLPKAIAGVMKQNAGTEGTPDLAERGAASAKKAVKDMVKEIAAHVMEEARAVNKPNSKRTRIAQATDSEQSDVEEPKSAKKKRKRRISETIESSDSEFEPDKKRKRKSESPPSRKQMLEKKVKGKLPQDLKGRKDAVWTIPMDETMYRKRIKLQLKLSLLKEFTKISGPSFRALVHQYRIRNQKTFDKDKDTVVYVCGSCKGETTFQQRHLLSAVFHWTKTATLCETKLISSIRVKWTSKKWLSQPF